MTDTLQTTNGPVTMGPFIPCDRRTGLPSVTSEAYDAQRDAYETWCESRSQSRWGDYLDARGDYEQHLAWMTAEWAAGDGDDEAKTLALEDAGELLIGDNTDMAQVYAVALCILRQRTPETPWIK